MIFDKVISLGPSCETAWQIRQIVDQPEAYVFDWIIAPPACVVQALRTNFSYIVQPERLSLRHVESGERAYILDEATGIEYHHDFQNDVDFLSSLPNVQQKYNFLIARMCRVLESDVAILFVHQMGTPEETRLLEIAVAERFPNLRFKLLELSMGASAYSLREEGRIIFGATQGRGASWQDRLPEWERIFDGVLAESFGRSLVRVDRALAGQR